MTTTLKGNTTEAEVLSALVQRNLAVLIPFGEGHPYDLVTRIGLDRFVRVQCKTGRVNKGCLVFNSRSTDHGRGQGTYAGLADVFGVYCPATDCVYVVPVNGAPTSVVYLRLEPARNNQRRGIRFAADYDINCLTDDELHELLCGPERHWPASALAN